MVFFGIQLESIPHDVTFNSAKNSLIIWEISKIDFEFETGMTYFTTGQLDDNQITFGTGDLAQRVAVFLTRHPGGLFGVIGFGLIGSFHLQRDEQVLGRIRIGT